MFAERAHPFKDEVVSVVLGVGAEKVVLKDQSGAGGEAEGVRDLGRAGVAVAVVISIVGVV